MLFCQNITKIYDGQLLLKNISLKVEKGEVISLCGPSGIGKTTLFNIIAGIELPNSGKIFLNDHDITGKPGSISYMMQNDLLLEHKNVIDNVVLPLIIRGMSKKDAYCIAIPYLSKFGIEGTAYKYPSELSGGMRQRVAFLRTYMIGNDVILLDEPFSALDFRNKNAMYKWFQGMIESFSPTIIFITHDFKEATMLTDKIFPLTTQSEGLLTPSSNAL